MRQNHQRRATGRSRTGAPRAAFVTAVAIAAVAATTALVLFGAGTAGAHTDLVSSDPAADAHLEHAPSAITLTFAGAPMELGATILVVGESAEQWTNGTATVSATTACAATRRSSAKRASARAEARSAAAATARLQRRCQGRRWRSTVHKACPAPFRCLSRLARWG